jgi:hypothetical protein
LQISSEKSSKFHLKSIPPKIQKNIVNGRSPAGAWN